MQFIKPTLLEAITATYAPCPATAKLEFIETKIASGAARMVVNQLPFGYTRTLTLYGITATGPTLRNATIQWFAKAKAHCAKQVAA